MPSFSSTFWKKYQSVIFDCDDTLIATAKKRWVALIATARLYDFDLNEATIRSSWGKPFDQLISHILPEVDIQAFLPIYQQAMRQFPPEPTPGAISLLQFLYKNGIRLDIITSSHQQLINQDLEELGMHHFFTSIWGCEQTAPYHKPDPHVLDPILKTLSIAGINHSTIICIGDSIRDYKVAADNHLDFIAVTSGLEDQNTFLAEGLSEKRIVASLEMLIPPS